MCFGLTTFAQSSMQEKMQVFARNYKEAPSQEKKMQICIDAINQGLIYLGGPVGNIDKIFGTTYSNELPKSSDTLKTGVVDFVRPILSPSGNIQASYSGWFLAFEFDNLGRIRNYYLSNTHK